MRPHTTALAIACFAVATPRLVASQVDSTKQTPPPAVKHVVKPGDTLWDIAKFYLKDPFRWPEVFRRNTEVVENPHWIYPGEVLLIDGSAVRDEVASKVDKDGFVVGRVQTQPAPGPTVFMAKPVPAPPPGAVTLAKPASYTIRQGEYDAAPWVVDHRVPLRAGTIVGALERPARGLTSTAGYKLYDRLYVTAPPGETFRAGDHLLLASRGDIIVDVGQVIEPTGILRVDSVPSSGPIAGTIVQQFNTIRAEQLTLPYDRSMTPTTVRPVPGTYPTTAKVLWIQNEPVLPSLQSYAVVGVSSGVQPGDQLTLYDQGPRVGDIEAPPVATATLQVIRVTPVATTVLLIRQTQPKVQRGMTARLTAKMP